MTPAAIGNRLKEAREKKSISLDEVHAKIKIHPRILQILEEEKFEKLPSPLYAKSFLRNYAEFLEVNPEEIMDAYEKQGKKVDSPDQVLYLKTEDEKFREKHGSQKSGALFVAAGAAVLVAALLFYVSKNFPSWTEGFTERAAASSKKEAKKAAPKAAVKPEAAAPAKAAASSEWLRSVEAGNFPKIGSKDELQLKIKAADNVWIHVTCDGKVLFQSILKKGATEAWTASKSIQVWTGNPSSMSLNLNGTPLGSPGKGSVKKMLITREGVKVVS